MHDAECKYRRSLLIGAATVALVLLPACREGDDPSRLRISGAVELDMVKIMPLIGGRIIELSIEEGSALAKGQVAARLDCAELDLQLVNAEAALKGGRARLSLLRNGAQTEDIEQARAMVQQQETLLANAKLNLDRARTLVEQKAVPQKQLDDAQTAFDATSKQVDAVRQQYKKVRGGARKEEIEVALAAVEQAQAAIDLIKKRQEYCAIVAPMDGVVLHKLAELGEVAAPGVALASMANLATVKAKGFVAEIDLPRVKLGGKAQVFTDAAPENPIDGVVTFISSEAEFTPKNIQTRTERVKTMYEIRVTVANASGVLKDGMPVEIELPQ